MNGLIETWIRDDYRFIVPLTVGLLIFSIVAGVNLGWSLARMLLPPLFAGLTYGVVELYVQDNDAPQPRGDE